MFKKYTITVEYNWDYGEYRAYTKEISDEDGTAPIGGGKTPSEAVKDLEWQLEELEEKQ